MSAGGRERVAGVIDDRAAVARANSSEMPLERSETSDLRRLRRKALALPCRGVIGLFPLPAALFGDDTSPAVVAAELLRPF